MVKKFFSKRERSVLNPEVQARNWQSILVPEAYVSPEAVTLVKSRYSAYKGFHSTMTGFYPALLQENHDCLEGYDGKGLSIFCYNQNFWSLTVLGQIDNAEGETSESILESGMIEDQVMPALPSLSSAAVTPYSNAYAHISVVEIWINPTIHCTRQVLMCTIQTGWVFAYSIQRNWRLSSMIDLFYYKLLLL